MSIFDQLVGPQGKMVVLGLALGVVAAGLISLALLVPFLFALMATWATTIVLLLLFRAQANRRLARKPEDFAERAQNRALRYVEHHRVGSAPVPDTGRPANIGHPQDF